MAWGIIIICTRSYLCTYLIFIRMQSYCEKRVSSDGAYVHALFVLLLAWDITIRCTIAYVYPCLVLRRIQRNCKKIISSGGASFHDCLGCSLPGVAE